MLLQLVQLVQCLGRTGVRSTQGLFKHACEFRMEASSSDVVALCQLPTSSLQLQCLQVQMEFHTCKRQRCIVACNIHFQFEYPAFKLKSSTIRARLLARRVGMRLLARRVGRRFWAMRAGRTLLARRDGKTLFVRHGGRRLLTWRAGRRLARRAGRGLLAARHLRAILLLTSVYAFVALTAGPSRHVSMRGSATKLLRLHSLE